MNLPTLISFANGNSIQYLYNAAGVKVEKKVHDTQNNTIKQVEYLDGFQYAGGVLQFFPTAEGYVAATPGAIGPGGYTYIFNYVYNYTDHLGNIRLSYTKDPVSGDLEIMEENHYYPFGLKHSVYADPKQMYKLDEEEEMARPTYVYETDYQYKYNGKELQDELGLNMYAMDMRQYDPAIARWVVMDPVVHHSMSPYNAFDNNPVFWADPSGADAENGGTGVTLAFGVSLDSVMGTSNVGFTSYADSYETTETRRSALIVGEDNPESLENLPDGVSVPDETRDYLSGASVRYYSATTTTHHEGGGDISGSFLSNLWNSTFTRLLIKDTYSIGLSSNVCAFLGTGTTPINFTLITRGKAPGIYFTPTVNGAVGAEVSANAGIAFSSGNYTGSPGQIEPSMLKGTSYGGSAEIGDVVSVSAGASYAPAGNGNGFINANVQVGVGIGAGAQINIQQTTKVESLIQF